MKVCAEPDCQTDLTGTHGLKQFCDPCKAKRQRQNRNARYRSLKARGITPEWAKYKRPPRPPKTCLDCPTDISARHRNAIRCRPCAKKHTNKTNRAAYHRHIANKPDPKPSARNSQAPPTSALTRQSQTAPKPKPTPRQSNQTYGNHTFTLEEWKRRQAEKQDPRPTPRPRNSVTG